MLGEATEGRNGSHGAGIGRNTAKSSTGDADHAVRSKVVRPSGGCRCAEWSTDGRLCAKRWSASPKYCVVSASVETGDRASDLLVNYVTAHPHI